MEALIAAFSDAFVNMAQVVPTALVTGLTIGILSFGFCALNGMILLKCIGAMCFFGTIAFMIVAPLSYHSPFDDMVKSDIKNIESGAEEVA